MLLPVAVPFFMWVTAFLIGLSLWSICHQPFRSSPSLGRCALVFVVLAAVPFFLLWLGARMMHYTERTPAPFWPSLIIIGTLLVTLALGSYALRHLSGWRGVFGSVFALQVWLTVATAFVAEISVSGDYYRWLR
jgi:hypothetical protein